MNEERILKTFLDLVQISSPSKHEAAVARYCTQVLEALGCEVIDDGSAAVTGSDTGNIIATLPGTAPGKLFITAHMDTVEPCENIKPIVCDGVVYSDGTTVLGADDKIGIAAALETVASLKEGGNAYPSVGLIFTVQEEIGLHGAQNIPDDLFSGELALVCDGDLAPGTVITASAYQYRFNMEFIGRAAHAGVAPERGISAIQMAACAIGRMQLGRIDETTTANVAEVKGGSAINVIPESCRLCGECRAMSLPRLEELRGQIEGAAQAAAAEYSGELKAQWEHAVEGFEMADDDPLVQLVLDAASQVGLCPKTDVSCGATDGNYYARKGAKPVILGTGMADFHSTREHLALCDLYDTARHLIAICQTAGRG